jgi:hypothetical protein
MTTDKIVLRSLQDGFDRFEIQGEYTTKKHQTYRKYIELNPNLTTSKVYACVRKPFERLISFYFAAFRWAKKDIHTNKVVIPDSIQFKEDDFVDMVKKLPTCLFYLKTNDTNKDTPPQLTIIKTERLEKDFANNFPTVKLTSTRNKTLFPELKNELLMSKNLRELVENSRHKMDLNAFYS